MFWKSFFPPVRKKLLSRGVFWFLLSLLIPTGIAPPPPPPQSITWVPGSYPQVFNVLKSDTAAVDILLLEAPILRVKTSHSKVVLREIPIWFDISPLGRKSHNIKKSLNKLHSMEFQLKSNFFSCPKCANEFLLHPQPLSFDNCQHLCQSQSSAVFANVQQFEELHNTNITSFEISTIWIQNKQEAKYKGYFDAEHVVSLQMGDKFFSLIPSNNFSTAKEPQSQVHCYTHYIQGFKKLNCTRLPVKTHYYQRENFDSTYYGKKFYSLQLKMFLDSSYELARANQLTNLSFVNYQRKHARFEVTTAPAQDELLNVRHFAKCVCTRPSFWSAREHQRVKSKIENLALKSQSLQLGIERNRLQKFTNFQQSNADKILHNSMQESRRKPPDVFLRKTDVHALLLNASLNPFFLDSVQQHTSSSVSPSPLEQDLKSTTISAFLENSSLISNLERQTLRNFERQDLSPLPTAKRVNRGLPIAAATLVAKQAAPYLISQSPAIMSSLAKKLQAVFMKEGKFDKIKQKADNISQYLSGLFGSDLVFNQTKDRFIADYPSIQNLIIDEKDSTPFDQTKLNVLEKALSKLEFFEKNIIQRLQQVFFEKLSPFIHSRIRPGGRVLASIQKSQSFVKFLYFFEENVFDSAITRYQFSSLPRYRTNDGYTIFKIQNLTLDLSQDAALNLGQGSALDCHELLLASIALPLEDKCPSEIIELSEVMLLQTAASLNFYVFKGFITLHFKCKGSHADSISLKDEINLVMIHQSCQISTSLVSGRSWKQIAIHPKTGDIFLNFGVTPLISYSLSRSSSFQDRATIFLISLAVIISILGILISLVIYCFLRFRRNLQMATLAAYFQNGKPSLQSVDLIDTNMFEQDRKNSAKSTMMDKEPPSTCQDDSPPPSISSEPPLMPLPTSLNHLSMAQTQASQFARSLKTVERKANSPASHQIGTG